MGYARSLIYNKLKDKVFLDKIPFSHKMKLVRYLLLNLKYKIKTNINFFTIYNLKPLPHMNVKRHEFIFLKDASMKAFKKSEHIYFLGQNLVEVGWMEEKVYLKYVKYIASMFHQKIIYKPHRTETVTKAYSSLWNENFVIDEEIHQGPIEYALVNNNIYPSVVISFFSSALFSLDKIFDKASIYSIKIEKKDLILKNDNLNIIDDCYAFLSSTKVKFIEVV